MDTDDKDRIKIPKKTKRKKFKRGYDSIEERNRKVASAIVNMEIGSAIHITPLAKSIQIHKDTLNDLLDLGDVLKEVGYKTIRDKDGKITQIIRTNEDIDLRRDISEIKKGIEDLKIKVKWI